MPGRPFRTIMIAGPTASGKSALALRLAREFGGIVLNADSMQVYRELAILTARPTAAETRAVPHGLYGFVPAAEAYSVGRFVADAAQAVAAAHAAGQVPILVGGTGLYFKALLEGLSPIPPIAADIRTFWRAEAERLGAAALHALLARRDPQVAARLMPQDKQRIVRALEVLEGTGRSLSAWQTVAGTPVLREAETVRLLVVPERSDLALRIDARFDAMLSAGALEEVRALGALGLSPELPAMRAHGVPPLLAHLRGEMSLEEAIATSKAQTRQYAKRQATWHRRNMMSWKRIDAKQMEYLSTALFPD